MITAAEIAHSLGLRRSGRTFSGACPYCGYSSGFTVQDSNGITLVCCHAGGCTQGDVISALRMRGLWTGEDDRQWRPPPPRWSQKPPPEPSEEKTKRAQSIWQRSVPANGTPVEVYLKNRGIDLKIPPTIRYNPSLKHSETGLDLPAMVSAVTLWPSRVPCAVHRTFLTQDGTRKSPVSSPKKSLGPIKGGAVRLAPAGPVLLVGEGIESTLSAMQASGLPGWAALSTGGMRALVLPDTVSEVTIAADNDSNGAGQDAARDAAARWTDEGRSVRIAMPPNSDSDFNDIIREVA